MADECNAVFCRHHEKMQWALEEQERTNAKMEMELTNLRREIQTKTPLRLFYTIITTFSALYVFGVVAVYTKVHQNSIDFYKGVAMIQVTQTELKERMAHTVLQGDRLEQELVEMRQHIWDEVKRVRKEILGEDR